MQNRAGYISARIIQLGYIQQDVMVVQECALRNVERKRETTITTRNLKDGRSQIKRNVYTEQKSMGDSRMSWQGRIYQLYVWALHCCENPLDLQPSIVPCPSD